MARIDQRIAIWQERLGSENEDIREGAGLSMLMHLQSSSWRKSSYSSSEYVLDLPERYGDVKGILFDAVEKGTLKSEPVVEWVAARKAEETLAKAAFDPGAGARAIKNRKTPFGR